MEAEAAKRLETAIRELETHLEEVKDLDPASRQLLADAVAGIQTRLESKEAVPQPETGGWSSRLSKAIAEIEVSHPGLATMVTRVCDFLDQAGI